MNSPMLGFRDTGADRLADLENKVFGSKISKARLRRNTYRAVLNQLASLQDANDYSPSQMVAAVIALETAPLDFTLNVSIEARGGK